MGFLRQTLALTAVALASIERRRGSSLVTVIGVATAVGVLLSLLAVGKGAAIFTGQDSDSSHGTAVVLSRGTTDPLQSAIKREDLAVIENAPGVKSTNGKPWVAAMTGVTVDVIRNDGKRTNTFLEGFSSGALVTQSSIRFVAGRQYRPGLNELTIPESLTKQYKNMQIGSQLNFHGTQWTIVGVFAGQDTVGDNAMRADAETVMSAFGRNTYQVVMVTLVSDAAFEGFKDALINNPAVSLDVETALQYSKDQFGQLTSLVDFISYFIGAVMAIGAVFGALNSLYASVDGRRREIATLRAIGFRSTSIVIAVLVEGTILALFGAVLGTLIAWLAFNGNAVDVQGLVFRLAVTPTLVIDGAVWGIAIGLLGASLPALRAAQLPIAKVLRTS